MRLNLVTAAVICMTLAGCAAESHPPAAESSQGTPSTQATQATPTAITAEANAGMCKLARYLMNSTARVAPVEAVMIQVAAKRGDASQPLRQDARALADAYLNYTPNADATAQASARISAYCTALGIPMP